MAYGHRKSWLPEIAASFVLVAAFFILSTKNYLLFHSFAELFSIVIAFGIFTLAWNTRTIIRNDYLLFIGIAYLFVAFIDTLHTLAYKGMGVFKDIDDNNLPPQLWIIARYMESLSLVIATLFFRRKLSAKIQVIVYSAVTAIFLLIVFYWQVFPTCFVSGVGLTRFKVASEYIICSILAVALLLLLRNKKEFEKDVLQMLVLSIVFTIATELSFTIYVNLYGLSNIVGHFFKILAFYFIYKAIVQTGLERPYSLVFRNLKKSEESLEHLNFTLKQRVEEEVSLSREKDKMLIQQSKLAAMGEMLSMIAHQWRQPLSSITTISGDMRVAIVLDTLDVDDFYASLQKINDQAQFLSKTIDNFRNFFNPKKVKETVSIRNVINQTINIIGKTLDYKFIKLTTECAVESELHTYPNELTQVLLNIIKNAQDALVDKQIKNAVIRIACREAQGFHTVEISDNAGGVPVEILDKIFEPYFTTKGEASGTGLGLYMSKTIIEQHCKGKLDVRNTEDGACFTIQLPNLQKENEGV